MVFFYWIDRALDCFYERFEITRETFPPLTRARDAVTNWLMSGGNRALLWLLLRTSNDRMALKYENRELKRQLEEFCTR
jgi:hypothetical protein